MKGIMANNRLRQILSICLFILFVLSGCGSANKKVDYDSIPMEKVTSTMIAETGYSEENQLLLVRFRSNGALYEYYDFSEDDYHDFLNADSLGNYFNNHIRDKYDYKLIEKPDDYEAEPLYKSATKDTATFVLNTSTGKFHKKDCRYASSSNVEYVGNTKEELIEIGYSPCKVCHP